MAPPTEFDAVTVTATRRETLLQDTPMSVTVLTGKEIADISAFDFRDYARFVPGLTFSDTGNVGDKYAIRGITTSLFTDRSPLTAVLLDDVPITNAGGLWQVSCPPDLELFDVRQIEVLRGPQGTLFGASAMGGVIRVMSNPPDPSRLEVLGEAGVATMDGDRGYWIRSTLNVPASGHEAATRLSAYRRGKPGYVDNAALNEDDVNRGSVVGARVAELWQATDRLDLTGKILYQKGEGSGSNVDDLADPPRIQSQKVPEPRSDRLVLSQVTAQNRQDSLEVISNTSYASRSALTRYDFTDALTFNFGIPDQKGWIAEDERTRDFAQELRVQSRDPRPVDWVAGILLQHRRFDSVLDFLVPGFDASTGGQASQYGYPDNLLREGLAATQRQYAVFGDLTYAITESTNASVGARWFRLEDRSEVLLAGLWNEGTTIEHIGYRESGVTPRVSLSHSGRNTTVYATAASGFRPGGANPLGNLAGDGDPFGCKAELAAAGYDGIPTLRSDSLWSYELGARGAAGERLLGYSLAVYHIDWSDVQTNHHLECMVLFNENAGKATSDGVEGELRLYPSERLELRATAAYDDARLADDAPNLNGRRGDPLPGVPLNTRGLMAGYRLLPGPQFPLWLRADYQYVGKSLNGIGPQAREMPAYEIFNLQLSAERGAWSLALFAHNLFDTHGIVGIYDYGAPEVTWEFTIDPRTLGLSAGFRY